MTSLLIMATRRYIFIYIYIYIYIRIPVFVVIIPLGGRGRYSSGFFHGIPHGIDGMPLPDDVVHGSRVLVGSLPVGKISIVPIRVFGGSVVLDDGPSFLPKGLVRVRDKGDGWQSSIVGSTGTGTGTGTVTVIDNGGGVYLGDGRLEQEDVLGSNGSTAARPTRGLAVLLEVVNKVVASIASVGTNDIFLERGQDIVSECPRQSKEENGAVRRRLWLRFQFQLRFRLRFRL